MCISGEIEYIFVPYDYENFTNMYQIYMIETFQIFNEKPYREARIKINVYYDNRPI
ncbi:phage-related protein [Clostridium beijerinckii]|uniref:Phage-related protein n=1 Tax=Clostridium beijerinckii TaxID=1520 RepID=A0AAE5H2T3_CLOBE|nr:phage-related protein [Clostridium beijerinckii]